jgi:iron(II)-dependent oxidoreductase
MGHPDHALPAADVLAAWARSARSRTLDLIADLDDRQLLGPQFPILNPPLWEVGHVAWFQERWVLRHANHRPPVRPDGDALYDSAAVAHDTRWGLLLSREPTLRYMAQVHEHVLERLANGPRPDEVYFVLLSIFHEDMHTEALTYSRQTLGYPAPRLSGATAAPGGAGAPWSGDAVVDGGTFLLGAGADEPFVFDNEKWAHPVALRPFAIARAPVTQAEFVAFVEDGGYRRREFWCPAGWAWREGAEAECPVYWRREAGGWQRRDFDRWVALEAHRPVIHVNWYEADAYCRWAGRRLPTEAEWEAAASLPAVGGRKRRFPWGEGEPAPARANLDGLALGCVGVEARPAGDSACGCRQMIGNVWEWTADDFAPYPGFVPDPYKEYSAPWFATPHKVLRGGCWATRGRLLRNTWRNFYRPDRRDVFAGLRTCAL